ncbi:MAG: NAD-dependent protein deacetylase [candidate division WS2 bacterium]|nr:NAD-dependent protein deacetylase [Bacillota bacterium]MBT9151333.1 NAD-dependent protein deacetylase [Candidatus Psychracetigena formicireducens]
MENLTDKIIAERIEKAFAKRIVFFVGAGISVPSGVPDFKKLNEEVIQTLADEELEELEEKDLGKKKEDYELLTENVRPEVMYQIAMDELGSEVLYSLEMLEGYEPNYYHYFLAEAIRRGNWIFTTNPDNLIEEACKRRGMKPEVDFKTYYGRGNDEDFREYLQNINSGDILGGCIFKLHGSIEEDAKEEEKYKTVRFSLRQVGEGLFGPRKEVLEYFLKEFDFCFIGYRCRDDFSVFPVLSGTKSDKDIFWSRFDEGPLSLYIPEEDRLLWEKEREENKPLDEERNLDLFNINEVLLQRGKKFVFSGNLGEFINVKLLLLLGIENLSFDEEKAREKGKATESEAFFRWAKGKEKFEKHLFLGRLFEQAGNLNKGIESCNKALGEAKNDFQLIWAKQKLADLYYRRQEGNDEEEASKLYEQCINSSKDPLERASLKASLSNVLRRRGKDFYSEAYDKAEEAKREFEANLAKVESFSEMERRKKKLDFARCLNIHGLALYSLGKFEEARKSCSDSIKIKQDLGDVDGIAESENAISLTFTQEGRRLKQEEAKEKFFKAVDHARRALDSRRKIGNFRGYAQNSRNLAWPNSELMKLALREYERQEYFKEARNGYKAGISYWDRFYPAPPVESVLFRNLLSRLYIDFCSQTQDEEQKKRWSQELIPIYRVILRDPKRKQVAKEDKRMPTAEQNLENIKVILKEVNLDLEQKEVERVLKELREE